MSRFRFAVRVCLVLLVCRAAAAPAAEPFRYPEAEHGKGQLKYRNGLPVLTVQGTPQEIGEQMAALALTPAVRLLNYPRDYLKADGLEATWPLLVWTGTAMLPQFPPDHRRELEAVSRAAKVDRNLLVVANTMFDIKKVAACSTLFAAADRSATRGPLLGRNLDYPTLGYLQDYSLVVIARPQGKHAFASVGFPGLIGCLSGINDAGLAVATLEVYSSRDGADKLDLHGTPYALCYRRLLEECTTIEEAEKLLSSMHRTTMNNLAVCDKHAGAVFEITPRTVVVRRAVDGLCPCTNHFRSKELATSCQCQRYDVLEKSRELPMLGLADMAKKLDAANLGKLTFQTMIFEPATLKLHLAIGRCPSSALPMKLLDLEPLLKQGSAGK